jgi:hypothetical protein
MCVCTDFVSFGLHCFACRIYNTLLFLFLLCMHVLYLDIQNTVCCLLFVVLFLLFTVFFVFNILCLVLCVLMCAVYMCSVPCRSPPQVCCL